MKTLSFIGSDKNSGKTVALNFVYKRLLVAKKVDSLICLTSIGLNGESVDLYETSPKPTIILAPGVFFITIPAHLKNLTGNYKIHYIFNRPYFKKNFILGECLLESEIILEGPNERREILQIKKILSELFHNCTLLIDGSIDRQFIANPAISDGFYFSLLLSDRKEQLQKATDLTTPLSFPICPIELSKLIKKECAKNVKIKSMIIGKKNKVLYIGTDIPFLDLELKKILQKDTKKSLFIYLNGALSKSLFYFLSPFTNANIILDNFTLYHNIQTGSSVTPNTFHPKFYLLNPVNVKSVFIKQIGLHDMLSLKKNIPVYNLYREDLSEIRI